LLVTQPSEILQDTIDRFDTVADISLFSESIEQIDGFLCRLSPASDGIYKSAASSCRDVHRD
jgi:hypothetical protein